MLQLTKEEFEEKLQKEVDFLTAKPQEIYNHWDSPTRNNSILFSYLGKGIAKDSKNETCYPGCLTQVRAWSHKAAIKNSQVLVEFTEKVRNDARIPQAGSDIKVGDLPVFAEYQREFFELNQ